MKSNWPWLVGLTLIAIGAPTIAASAEPTAVGLSRRACDPKGSSKPKASKSAAPTEKVDGLDARSYIDLPGLWYQEDSKNPSGQAPINIQIVPVNWKTPITPNTLTIYGPGVGEAVGWTVGSGGPGRIKLFDKQSHQQDKGDFDATYIKLDTKKVVLRKWIIPTTWYDSNGDAVLVGNSQQSFLDLGASVSVGGTQSPILDVVESTGQRWRFKANPATNQFTATPPDGKTQPGTFEWFTSSIKFKSGNDWTPFPKSQGFQYREINLPPDITGSKVWSAVDRRTVHCTLDKKVLGAWASVHINDIGGPNPHDDGVHVHWGFEGPNEVRVAFFPPAATYVDPPAWSADIHPDLYIHIICEK